MLVVVVAAVAVTTAIVVIEAATTVSFRLPLTCLEERKSRCKQETPSGRKVCEQGLAIILKP